MFFPLDFGVSFQSVMCEFWCDVHFSFISDAIASFNTKSAKDRARFFSDPNRALARSVITLQRLGRNRSVWLSRISLIFQLPATRQRHPVCLVPHVPRKQSLPRQARPLTAPFHPEQIH